MCHLSTASLIKIAALSGVFLTGWTGIEASAQLPSTELAWYTNGWMQHTIDDSSEGADGVKVADANKDGLIDIVTGWEEGGVVRVYLNPGPAAVKMPWPAIEVGKVNHVEDAVFADVNADGVLDVVSAAEGSTKKLFFHIAPSDLNHYNTPSKWMTTTLAAAKNQMRWMFAIPWEVNGKIGTDFIAAGKDENAGIGWFEAPDSRLPEDWAWHPLARVSWVMSIISHDIDKDGWDDLVYTDRKGVERGIYWFKYAGDNAIRPFAERQYLGGKDHELMFMAIGDVTANGKDDIVVPTRNKELLLLTQNDMGHWQEEIVPFPVGTGTGKGVAIADVDGDGYNEIIVTCEHAEGNVGVFYLDFDPVADGEVAAWNAVAISGSAGTKFDRIELLDMDDDGDLDVVTCEEKEGLGVIWYENPLK